MKKFSLLLSLLMIIAMMLTLASCGDSSSDPNDNTPGIDDGILPDDGKKPDDGPIGHIHEPADTYIENEIPPTCGADGSYDEVVLCYCGEEISRNTKAITDRPGHTDGEAVVENEVPASCKNEGSYDEVVYCSECGDEISRVEKTIPKLKTHSYTDGVCSVCGQIKPKPGEGIVFVQTGNNTCTLSSFGTCVDTEVVIPTVSPEGYTVTAIGDAAFQSCSDIVSVTIPDSVKKIGNFAFAGCESLETINFGAGVDEIGEKAFYLCVSLGEVYIPENVKTIKNNAFSQAGMTKLTVAGATAIYDYAFEQCESLTEVVLGDSIINIGRGVLYFCNSLEKLTAPFLGLTVSDKAGAYLGYLFGANSAEENAIRVPKTLSSLTLTSAKTIGTRAVYNCEGLQTVSLPSSVTAIGEYAFSGCKALSSLTVPFIGATRSATENAALTYFFTSPSGGYSIPDTLKSVAITDATKIAANAFNNCRKIESVSLSGELTAIGENAFAHCESLSKITIPEGIRSIGQYAFRGCRKLTSVTIPDSVTVIGVYAFYECYSLRTVNLGSGIKKINNYTFYQCSIENLTLPKQIEEIGDYAFSKCSSLKSLTLNSGLRTIGAYAFSECYSLAEITVPSTVTALGSYAFSQCRALESATLGSGIVTVEEYTFVSCSKLSNVTLGSNVKTISSGAFEFCGFLKTISIPASVTAIESEAFGYCGITSIEIPDTVLIVGERAFHDCDDLVEAKVGKGIESFGAGLFYGCTSLESLTVPFVGATYTENNTALLGFFFDYSQSSSNSDNSQVPGNLKHVTVTKQSYICPSMFASCIGIVSVNFENLTSIGSGAFYGCQSLESFAVPETVTALPDYVFYNCRGLKSISFTSTLTDIGEYVFDNCNSLTAVHITDLKAWCAVNFSYGSNPLRYAKNLYLNGNLVTDLVIPEGVEEIKSMAFHGGECFLSITIPSSVTIIGKSAFADCTKIESLEIPFIGERSDGTGGNYVSFIFSLKDYYEESLLQNLKTLKITGSTDIPSSAFKGCPNLESVAITGGVKSIADYAFNKCTALKSLSLSESVEYIGEAAFGGCSKLERIELNTVKTLGDEVFARCESLKSLTIGDQIESIGIGIVKDCPSLESLTVPFIGETADTNFNLGYFFGSTSSWKSLVPESLSSVTVTNAKVIEQKAFENCSGITVITLNEGITSIGNSAFSGCSSLKSITIPASLTELGGAVFSGCTSLTDMYIEDLAAWCNIKFSYLNPTHLSGIKNFYVKGVLTTNLVIPEGIKKKNDYTFSGATFMTSITLPNTLEQIGKDAFCNCSSLKEIVIPNSVTHITYGAFKGCSSMERITVPFIGTDADRTGSGSQTFSNIFSGSVPASLKTVIYTGSTLYSSSFDGCNNIENLVIMDTCTTIERLALINCNGISNVCFENPSAWRAGKTLLSAETLSNCEIAADYLRNLYVSVAWTRV